MKTFNDFLEEIGEVGYADQVLQSIVYASGLPSLKPGELVVFESGELGRAVSISENQSEILTLSHKEIKVGEKIARTNKFLEITVSDDLLGKIIDPLGTSLDGPLSDKGERRQIDITPPGMIDRDIIKDPLETGVILVDLTIPLGKGQRELIIGDRKTGKTQFFERTMTNQAKKGNICIYAAIGKKAVEIKHMKESIDKRGIGKNVVFVASSASDSPGLVFTTPYTAMAIAEYFKDKGKDVVVFLDDLTNHAMYYRQIALLSRRFPGRSSYPGDIFYIHSKILERAGKFKKGSITCFPVAESIMGDFTGVIQTNLMSMTDGHIFFDLELANLGRHPAINPFLSVTRSGQQAQTPLVRDLSRELSSFLINLERLRGFLHFGAEISNEIRQKLDLGDRILSVFDQPADTVPINVSLLIIALLWIGFWKDGTQAKMREKVLMLIKDYEATESVRNNINSLIQKSNSFASLLDNLRAGDYGQKRYY
ncbi:MAG TPA: hypothetical protein VLE44_01235 [Candidatus Saccharimonadales bacterium]|nr:hypothetical protein [Candidatus Saccharimonadales bacterium]